MNTLFSSVHRPATVRALVALEVHHGLRYVDATPISLNVRLRTDSTRTHLIDIGVLAPSNNIVLMTFRIGR